MICPSCRKAIHFEETDASAYEYDDPEKGSPTGYDVAHGFCPACGELIVLLREGTYQDDGGGASLDDPKVESILYPETSFDGELPDEVPEPYRSDYREAVAVLGVSPKASAAISRRMLQAILSDKFAIGKGSLAEQIQEFINKPGIPSFLAEAVDAVRAIGNIAAHPIKSKNTGAIVPVEPGEAEWLVEVLDTLCDFAFVQPKRLQERREQLNQKLQELGKPPLKGGVSNQGGDTQSNKA